MSDMQQFEQQLAARLRAYAAPAARRPQPEAVARAVAAAKDRHGAVPRLLRWPALRHGRRLWMLTAGLLVLGLLGGTIAGSFLPRPDQGLVVVSPSPLMSPAPSPSPVIGEDPLSIGYFSPAGSLSEPRSGHTATLLEDGRVLIVGGAVVGADLLQTPTWAEVWDQDSGSFQPAGALAVPRYTHTATLLADGRVLIVGGVDEAGQRLTSVEIWDPATETFGPAGPMAQPRWQHASTLLADGRVLLVGGDRDGQPVTAETWDPADGAFSPAGSLPGSSAGGFHVPISATLVWDGRVLIVGGFPLGTGDPLFAHMWDPATESIGASIPIPVSHSGALWGHTTTLLPDGRVLIRGSDAALVWEPESGSISRLDLRFGLGPGTDDVALSRDGHTAALLSDGRVLIVGGSGYGADTAEIWDPRDWSIRWGPTLSEAREGHTATALDDGRILVVGGGTSAELWHPR
jgi:hypothetical protein